MSGIPAPAELFDLRGTRAVVVGGTGVLGSRFCRVLAAAGAHVTVAGRDESRGLAVVGEIEAADGTGRFARIEVGRPGEVARFAEDVTSDGPVDVLVNAAGVNSATPFDELGRDEWDRLLDVNLSSVFELCQALTPSLARSAVGGAIVNISSASSGPPLTRVLGYGVAKAGLNNLTQYLATELADRGIRVNALVPGFFPAEQNRRLLSEERVAAILGHTPARRLGRPGDLDGALLWLASSRASGFVTGALVRVDGGFSAMTI